MDKNLWKKINIVFLFILIFVALAPQNVFAEVNTVKYEGETDYPPYKYINKDQYTGFDVSLTNLIFKDEDYLLEYSYNSFDNAYEKLKNGEIDTCGLLAINNERKKEVLFSNPIITTYVAIYTRSNFQKVDINNIKNFRIGVGASQYPEKLLKDTLQIKNYLTYVNVEQAIDALQNGEIDILFENQEVVNYLIIQKAMNDEIIQQQQELFPIKIAYGVSKGNEELVEYINTRLKTLIQSGVYEEIYQKYFSSHSDFYKNRNKTKILNIITMSIIILLITYFIIVRYITYLRKKIGQEQEFSTAILNEGNILILALKKDGTIIKLNKYAETVLGIQGNNFIGKLYNNIDNLCACSSFIDEILERTKRGEAFSSEKNLTISNMEATHEFLFKINVIKKNEDYEIIFIGIDITEGKKYQEKLESLAYKDSLTELPNRKYMYYKFNNDFIDNSANTLSAVVLIDVDNFKYLNDTLGHAFGDSFIIKIVERLNTLIDKDKFLVRLGGDSFIFCIRNIKKEKEIEEFAESILTLITKPFDINENENAIQITISLGIAISPKNGTSIDELLKKSDQAMHSSKTNGKNKYTFFDESMNLDVIERVQIEKHLRNALQNNEFSLFYQPQVDIHSGNTVGFEALIRWNSPQLGFVPPVKFIGIAEENHMIVEIGKWVLSSACAFIKEIHELGQQNCSISVNVSVLQLIKKDFEESVIKVLDSLNLDPKYLILEITESIYIEYFESICEKLNRLRAIGVKIALDDFGTGYSSLSYLKQLPIDTLKIDKSFIDDIEDSEEKSLVENIIMIGHKMGFTIVAEGVETKDQRDYLKKASCDKIQGYYFSRPIPKEKALNYLLKNYSNRLKI